MWKNTKMMTKLSFILQTAEVHKAKKVVLFPEIGRVKSFLSLTRPHSQMCIRIYIFNFKKQQIKNNKKETFEKSVCSWNMLY